MHVMEAIGLNESKPSAFIAGRLDVTMGTFYQGFGKSGKIAEKTIRCLEMEIRINMDWEKLNYFVSELCRYAQADEEFQKVFLKNLKEDEEICAELAYYMEKGSFACRAKVCCYTVVDIMVWQMDHFKARLDRDNTGTRQNGDKMVLLSFDTLLKMKKNPEVYLQRLQSETGTDYPGKY